MNPQNDTELRAAYERIAELESVLTLIRDGLADTGSGRTTGARMTMITKADAHRLADTALCQQVAA
jgi:hypothetical protein